MKTAVTNDRNYRTFLLMAQLEAKAIGARIALARKEAGMTQEDVGDLASFSKRSLQDYETGVTIPYKHLRELSGLLDRPVEWYLHGEPSEEATAEALFAPRLDDIEEKLDRLTASVEKLAESVAASQSDPGDGRSPLTGTDDQ